MKNYKRFLIFIVLLIVSSLITGCATSSVATKSKKSKNTRGTRSHITVINSIKVPSSTTLGTLYNPYNGNYSNYSNSSNFIKGGGRYSVYLTSDDGPLKGTRELNQIINDKKTYFTIFIVGKHIFKNSYFKNSYMNYYKNNHFITLGNHSYSHADGHYSAYYAQPPEEIVKDFLKNEKVAGIYTKIARLPGVNAWYLGNGLKRGKRKEIEVAKELYKYGYRVFGWDYELKHNGRGYIVRNASEHYKRIKNALIKGYTFQKGKIVILMHDQMFSKQSSIDELKILIDMLKADKEITIRSLTEY